MCFRLAGVKDSVVPFSEDERRDSDWPVSRTTRFWLVCIQSRSSISGWLWPLATSAVHTMMRHTVRWRVGFSSAARSSSLQRIEWRRFLLNLYLLCDDKESARRSRQDWHSEGACLPIHMCVCLPVCQFLTVCLSVSVYLPVCVSVFVCLPVCMCMSASLSVFLSVRPSVRVCVCLSVRLSVNVSICVSASLSVYLLSVCPSVCLSASLSVFFLLRKLTPVCGFSIMSGYKMKACIHYYATREVGYNRLPRDSTSSLIHGLHLHTHSLTHSLTHSPTHHKARIIHDRYDENGEGGRNGEKGCRKGGGDVMGEEEWKWWKKGRKWGNEGRKSWKRVTISPTRPG